MKVEKRFRVWSEGSREMRKMEFAADQSSLWLAGKRTVRVEHAGLRAGSCLQSGGPFGSC